MENEMHFMVARERKDIELHDKMYPDKGPWCVRWLENHRRASKHEYLIFSDLIEEIRSFVQNDGVTVHLYNVMGEPLLQINSENVGASLYEILGVLKITRKNIKRSVKTTMSFENNRPICPNCQERAGLEPAHWRTSTKHGQWRWVCVGCDYAVSSIKDEMFYPTGDLGSRKKRELRHEAQNELSKLWTHEIMSKSDTYSFLRKHFGIDKGREWNLASMSKLQLNETISLSKNILQLWKEKKQK